jgi:hypothetical protein
MSGTQLKIGGVMTTPRYENSYARTVIERAFHKVGIPLTNTGGPFYGQCMQAMFNDAIKANCDYIITTDFDSLFTEYDLRALIQTTVNNDLEAVAALQSRRGSPFPLLTKGGETLVEFTGEPLRVSTAHFGLTMISVKHLKQIAKPWFWSKPDDQGEWQEGKLDDDIYFWAKWREAGFRVFVDSSVSIGHLEEMVAVFDADGKHKHIYPHEWTELHLRPTK